MPKKSYSKEQMLTALRILSDGGTLDEAEKGSGCGGSSVCQWGKKYGIKSGSFLSDEEIMAKISAYGQPKVGRPASPPPKPEWLPAPGIKLEEKPELSPEQSNQLADAIKLTVGEKEMNQLNNAVVAMIAGAAEQIKKCTTSEEAIQMVTSAISLKELLNVLEAPPMAMNWNDVAKIVAMLREANNMAPPKAEGTSTINSPVNVTILNRKPKREKIIDAETILDDDES